MYRIASKSALATLAAILLGATSALADPSTTGSATVNSGPGTMLGDPRNSDAAFGSAADFVDGSGGFYYAPITTSISSTQTAPESHDFVGGSAANTIDLSAQPSSGEGAASLSAPIVSINEPQTPVISCLGGASCVSTGIQPLIVTPLPPTQIPTESPPAKRFELGSGNTVLDAGSASGNTLDYFSAPASASQSLSVSITGNQTPVISCFGGVSCGSTGIPGIPVTPLPPTQIPAESPPAERFELGSNSGHEVFEAGSGAYYIGSGTTSFEASPSETIVPAPVGSSVSGSSLGDDSFYGLSRDPLPTGVGGADTFVLGQSRSLLGDFHGQGGTGSLDFSPVPASSSQSPSVSITGNQTPFISCLGGASCGSAGIGQGNANAFSFVNGSSTSFTNFIGASNGNTRFDSLNGIDNIIGSNAEFFFSGQCPSPTSCKSTLVQGLNLTPSVATDPHANGSESHVTTPSVNVAPSAPIVSINSALTPILTCPSPTSCKSTLVQGLNLTPSPATGPRSSTSDTFTVPSGATTFASDATAPFTLTSGTGAVAPSAPLVQSAPLSEAQDHVGIPFGRLEVHYLPTTRQLADEQRATGSVILPSALKQQTTSGSVGLSAAPPIQTEKPSVGCFGGGNCGEGLGQISPSVTTPRATVLSEPVRSSLPQLPSMQSSHPSGSTTPMAAPSSSTASSTLAAAPVSFNNGGLTLRSRAGTSGGMTQVLTRRHQSSLATRH